MPAVVAAVVAWAVPAATATAFTIAGTAISYATLIGYAVTIGASIAYSSSQNAKMRNMLKNSMADQGRNVMARDPLAFQRKIYGAIPTSGPVFFMHTTGAKNEILHVIMGIAGHECKALETLYFDGTDGMEEVPLDGTGTNGGGNALGKYAGKFFCNKYLGTPDQTTDATLSAAAPGLWTANHRLRGHTYIYLRFTYDTDIYPNGMPTVKVFTRGAKLLDPRVGIYTKTCGTTSGSTNITMASTASLAIGQLVVGAGILPGTRVTAVGAGNVTVNVAPKITNTAARLAFGVDSWSDNAALCCADYMADFKFGRSIPWYRINQTALISEANICDENVGIAASYTRNCDYDGGNKLLGFTTQNLAQMDGLFVGMRVSGPGIVDGAVITSLHYPEASNPSYFFSITEDSYVLAGHYVNSPITFGDIERRYSCNGMVTADQDALPELLTSMGGRVIDAGGTWTLVAGAYRSPSLTFTDADIVGSFSMQPRQSMRESYSGVRGTYISSRNAWQPADFPAVKNDTYTAQDGGVRRWKDVVYPFTISSSCSQRLAKADLERGRQQIVIQAVFKLKAFQVQCCDTIRLTRASLGWTNKEFEVLKWSLRILNQGKNNIALAVAVTARETAAAVWDWNDGQETDVDIAPNTTLPSPFSVNNVAGFALLTDSTTVIVNADGTVFGRIKATWTTPNNIYVESGGRTEMEYRVSGAPDWIPWNGRIRGDALVEYITDVKVGVQYDVRVRHVNEIGVHSPAWVQLTSAAVVGDTTTPNGVTNLVVTAQPGYLRVTWTPSTSNAVNEYSIYRATAGAGGPFTFMADTPNSQFDDPSVVSGTTYWYKVFSRTRSEYTDAGVVSSGVIALLPAVGATIPNNPSAPSSTGSGTYDATDGSVFSYHDISVAALPTNAIWQNLLYRRNGATDWLIGAQLKNVGVTSVRLDDLSPGVVYNIAMQAWSAAGGSSIITGGSITAPTKTNMPPDPKASNAYGGVFAVGGTNENVPPRYDSSGVRRYAFRFRWSESCATDPTSFGGYIYPADFDHWEVKGTATDSDIATDYNIDDGSGLLSVIKTKDTALVLCCNSPVNTYIRLRAVNTSGVASNWQHYGGGPFWGVGSWIKPGGEMQEQAKNAVNIDGGTIDGITDLNIVDGGTGASTAAGARTNLGLGTAALLNANNMGAISMTTLTSTNGDGYTPIMNGTGVNNISFKWSGSEFHFRIDVTDFICPGRTSKSAAIPNVSGTAVTIAEDFEARDKIDDILAVLRDWNMLTP